MLPHQWISDPREPLFTFSLPSVVEGTYGVYMLSIPFWVETLSLLVVHLSLAAITAALVYTMIVKPNKQESSFAYLLGYGAILPFWLVAPWYWIHLFGIHNDMIKFAAFISVPTLAIFRTTAAIHGFCPTNATKSLFIYVRYFSSPTTYAQDKSGSFVKATFATMIHHLLRFILWLFVLGCYHSWLSTYPNWLVFGSPADTEEWYSFGRVVSLKQWGSNLFVAFLFQLYLATYCEGLTLFSTVLSGYKMKPTMDDPLLKSTSPSNFWGRRWNSLVQTCLKNGVFKPVYKHFSKPAAVMATFVASGLLHEWLVLVLWSTPPVHLGVIEKSAEAVEVVYGGSMVFFVWQAILILVESLVGNWEIFKTMGRILPAPVRTALIVCAGIPFAHHFFEPYVRSNYFDHAQVGIPMIKLLD